MSLKKFHIFFITVSLGLMVFVGIWAIHQRGSGKEWVGTGVSAAVGFALGLVYANWFRRKYL
jgi:ABC-type Mn2+/Zn2+ transport system permease subunit